MRNWQRIRRQKMNRTSPYRCEGVTQRGTRCLQSGWRREDGKRMCHYHWDQPAGTS